MDAASKEALETEVARLRIQHEAARAAHEAALGTVETEELLIMARVELRDYLKAVAGYYFGSMAGFHKVVVRHYLEEKPWVNDGWEWLFPKNNYSFGGGAPTIKGGWQQYSITLPADIAQGVRETHAEVQAANPKISLASFLYTMLVWAIANYFPPKKSGGSRIAT